MSDDIARTYTTDPFPAVGRPEDARKRWYPKDIRPPQTLQEAEAALELIDTSITSVEVAITAGHVHLQGPLEAWQRLRVGIAYIDEKMRAGESPKTSYLADVARVEEKMRRQQKELGRIVAENAELREKLRARSEDFLLAENAELKAALADARRELATQAVTEKSIAQATAMKTSFHDALAERVYMIDAMKAAGVELPPIARMARYHAMKTMKTGHYANWLARERKFFDGAAEAWVDDDRTDE